MSNGGTSYINLQNLKLMEDSSKIKLLPTKTLIQIWISKVISVIGYKIF